MQQKTGEIGTGFGIYNGICKEWVPFSIDVIYPWALEEDGKDRKTQERVFKKHLRRCKPKKSYFIHETPEMYENIMKPLIDNTPTAHLQWVYDILDGT